MAEDKRKEIPSIDSNGSDEIVVDGKTYKKCNVGVFSEYELKRKYNTHNRGLPIEGTIWLCVD